MTKKKRSSSEAVQTKGKKSSTIYQSSAKDNINKNCSSPEKCTRCESTVIKLEKLSTEAKKAIIAMKSVLSNVVTTISDIKSNCDISGRDFTSVTKLELFTEEMNIKSNKLYRSPEVEKMKMESVSFSKRRINELGAQSCKESSTNTVKESFNNLEEEGIKTILSTSDNCDTPGRFFKHLTNQDLLDEKSTIEIKGKRTTILLDGLVDKQNSSSNLKNKSDKCDYIESAANTVNGVPSHLQKSSKRKNKQKRRKKQTSHFLENKTASDNCTDITKIASIGQLENGSEICEETAHICKRKQQLIEAYIISLSIIMEEKENINKKIQKCLDEKRQNDLFSNIYTCVSNFYPFNASVDNRRILEKFFDFLNSHGNSPEAHKLINSEDVTDAFHPKKIVFEKGSILTTCDDNHNKDKNKNTFDVKHEKQIEDSNGPSEVKQAETDSHVSDSPNAMSFEYENILASDAAIENQSQTYERTHSDNGTESDSEIAHNSCNTFFYNQYELKKNVQFNNVCHTGGDHEIKNALDSIVDSKKQVNITEQNVAEGTSTSNNFEFSNSMGNSNQSELIFKHSCNLIEITKEYANLKYLKANDISNSISLIQTAELFINVSNSYAMTLQAVTTYLTDQCQFDFKMVNQKSSVLGPKASVAENDKELNGKYLEKFQKIQEKSKALFIQFEKLKTYLTNLMQIWGDHSHEYWSEYGAWFIIQTTMALLSMCYTYAWHFRKFTTDVFFLKIDFNTLMEF